MYSCVAFTITFTIWYLFTKHCKICYIYVHKYMLFAPKWSCFVWARRWFYVLAKSQRNSTISKKYRNKKDSNEKWHGKNPTWRLLKSTDWISRRLSLRCISSYILCSKCGLCDDHPAKFCSILDYLSVVSSTYWENNANCLELYV